MKKDEFGPEYVVKVYDPQIEMEGFLIIDNTLWGPGKGGIRMTPDVTEEEIFRLARIMTWKTALAELPFGGAKTGIIWKGGSDQLKKQYIQSFAKAIKIFIPKKYIAGPDIGTGEREMRWFMEATGDWRSATGKPANLCLKIFGKLDQKCGIPHEFGSTGFGVAQATKVAIEIAGFDMKKITVAIHGFGNVGSSTYRYLTQMGAKVIALADKSGVVWERNGFDQKKINEVIDQRKPLSYYPGREKIRSEDFWKIPIDILIPASMTDVINESNKNDIQAKIIIEAGNIPMPEYIEEEFFAKGILIVPDFVANAGGVISSFAEYRGYNPKRMFELVERKIKKTTKMVLEKSIKNKTSPRKMALQIAQTRVREKMKK